MLDFNSIKEQVKDNALAIGSVAATAALLTAYEMSSNNAPATLARAIISFAYASGVAGAVGYGAKKVYESGLVGQAANSIKDTAVSLKDKAVSKMQANPQQNAAQAAPVAASKAKAPARRSARNKSPRR